MTELTKRETQLLDALATDGASNKKLACLLGITEQTAKVHVKNVLHKIGVHNRTHAAVWWLRQQLSP